MLMNKTQNVFSGFSKRYSIELQLKEQGARDSLKHEFSFLLLWMNSICFVFIDYYYYWIFILTWISMKAAQRKKINKHKQKNIAIL